MEDLLLEATVRELRTRLPARVARIEPAGAGLVLTLGTGAARILAHPGPPFPRIHPVAEVPARPRGGRSAWPAAAAIAASSFETRLLQRLEKAPGDRRVDFDFVGESGEPAGRLVAECFPPGRLIVLDARGRVAALLGRQGERCLPGAAYAPLPVRDGPTLYGPDDRAVDPAALEAAEARLPEEGAGGAGRLRLRLAGMSPALERRLLLGAPGGAGLAEVVRALRRALSRPPVACVVLGVPADPEDGPALLDAALEAWPAVLAGGEGGEPFPSAGGAVGRLASLAAAAGDFAGRAGSLSRILRAELQRAERAGAALRSEAAEAEEPAVWRRRGEALLAAPPGLRAVDGVFRVQDPYEPEGPPLVFPAPPGAGRTEAADDFFRRARRGQRAAQERARRAAEVGERREKLAELVERAGRARRADDLDALEHEAREQGILVGVRPARPGRPEPARARLPARVFRSADGLEILVGRGGRENDELTFRIARPEDFWLHALAAAGAHVVVRNPTGLKSLPSRTLREAASLAAHYSGARSAAWTDVQVTRRRFVRRARGASPGTVLVKKAATVRASTAHPLKDQPGAR